MMCRCTASLPASGWATAVWAVIWNVIWLVAATAGAQPAAPETVRCRAVLTPGELRPGDLFGCALDAAGTLAVVGSVEDDGAGTDAGAVYVYRGGGAAGGFQQVAKVTATALRPGDRLGFAVATDGERFVAGAPFHDGAARDGGGAWVFAPSQAGVAGWGEEAQLSVGSLGGGLDGSDQLGYAVALDGPWAAAGAPGDDDRGDAAGAVYLFFRGQTGWQPFAKLTASDGAVGDGFGASLALSGDTLLVGAPYRDGPGREAGAAYVFRLGDNGWNEAQKLTGDGGGGSLFGHAVDVVGGRAAVGARGDDRAGPDAGTAYLYRRAGGEFAAEQRLTVPAGDGGVGAGDELGVSVALGADEDGELALVGARFDDQEAMDSGAVYLFRPATDGSGWRAVQKLKQETPGSGDELGYAVALAGDQLIAGAYLDDDAGSDAGLVCEVQTDMPRVCPPPGQCPCTPGCPCVPGCPSPTQLADLGVAIACPGSAVPGAAASWIVSVTNNGPTPSSAALTLVPPSPPGVTPTCTSPGGAVVPCAPGALAVPLLAAGATSGPFTITAPLPLCQAGSSLTASASVVPTSAVSDRNAGNDSFTCPAVVVPPTSYDLGVAYVDPAPAVGQVLEGPLTLTYRVTVSNAGPGPANGVSATFASPGAPFSLLSADPSCSDGVCSLGGLAAGTSRELTFVYAASASCSQSATTVAVSHAISVAADTPVCNLGSATGAESISEVVLPAAPCESDLSLTKTAPTTAVAGGTLVYTLTVTNAGPDGPVAARVVDDVPDVLSTVTWSCTGTPGVVCPLQPQGEKDVDAEVGLPAGGVATFTVVGTLPPAFCGPLDNAAVVVAGPGVTNTEPTNDADSVSTLVLPSSGVCVLKSLLYGQLVAGGSVIYQVLLLNGGPAVADGVGDEFSDTLPGELALVSATASSGTVATAGNLVTWNGGLPAGGAVTITINASLQNVVQGDVVCNQGELLVPVPILSDDPQLPGSEDPTCFTIPPYVPALGAGGLALLALLLAAAGWLALRRLG